MSEKELLIKIQTVLRTPCYMLENDNAFAYRKGWVDEILTDIQKQLETKDG